MEVMVAGDRVDRKAGESLFQFSGYVLSVEKNFCMIHRPEMMRWVVTGPED